MKNFILDFSKEPTQGMETKFMNASFSPSDNTIVQVFSHFKNREQLLTTLNALGALNRRKVEVNITVLMTHAVFRGIGTVVYNDRTTSCISDYFVKMSFRCVEYTITAARNAVRHEKINNLTAAHTTNGSSN